MSAFPHRCQFSLLTASSTKDAPDLNEYIAFCPGCTQCKPNGGLLLHIGVENDQNLKPIFKKNA